MCFIKHLAAHPVLVVASQQARKFRWRPVVDEYRRVVVVTTRCPALWDHCLEYVRGQAHSSNKSRAGFSLVPSNRAMKGSLPMIDGVRVGRQYGRHPQVEPS